MMDSITPRISGGKAASCSGLIGGDDIPRISPISQTQ
jgi:hypothetical protein